MADSRAFAVYDSSGAPVTGAAAGMSALAWSIAGASRTPPGVTELGAGLYEVTPSDTDETAGTVVLVDTGAGNEPRRYIFACYKADRSNQFFAVLLEDEAGALWAGAAPSFGAYDDATGAARTPPAVVTITAGVYVAVPTTADVTADSAGRLDSPAGAVPRYYSVATQPEVASSGSPWDAPSPGPLFNPAWDIASFLNGKTSGTTVLTKGTNLFAGPMRSQDRHPSPGVWCLNTGGGAPEPYLDGANRTALFRPTVQVMVRGPAGDVESGEALARGLVAWLHQRVVAGYASFFVRESSPVYLGDDEDQHGLWSLNVECVYRSSLG